MQHMKKMTLFAGIGVAAAMALTSSASAGIVTVDPFTGSYSEGFEGRGFGYRNEPISLFSGVGSLDVPGDYTGVIISHRWTFRTTVEQHSGAAFVGSPSREVEYTFNSPVSAFGGFFATNSDQPNGTATFYDADDQLIDAALIEFDTSGDWFWNGWESDVAFSRVVVRGNYGSGGFVMMDSMELIEAPIPAPGAIIVMAGGMLIGRCQRRRR